MTETSFFDSTVRTYIAELSAKKIVPGGGSASALTACVGAGLNLMVINFSIKPDEPTNAALEELKKRQEESKSALESLVDEDCKKFEELMKALALKEASDEEYINAAKAPLETCCQCRESIDITQALSENANKNLLTDIGCAGHILRASFDSACLNVEVNLKYIKDEAFVNATGLKLKELREEIHAKSGEIERRVNSIMSTEG